MYTRLVGHPEFINICSFHLSTVCLCVSVPVGGCLCVSVGGCLCVSVSVGGCLCVAQRLKGLHPNNVFVDCYF